MVKRNILALYEEYLGKYDDENAFFRNYVYSVKCIAESMIGNYCRNVTNSQITLDLYAESDNFKLFMGDTGLLIGRNI